MCIAVLERLQRRFIDRVRMADRGKDALPHQPAAQLHRALQLGRDAPAQDTAVGLFQNFFVMLASRRDDVALVLRALL